jgi:TolB-like protein/Tfp pilus assembly protein PilF
MTGGKEPKDQSDRPTDLLESWKEIAAYLRRGVRTVRRWEKDEALPVHRQRHKKLGTVYARRSELDAWREARSTGAAAGAVHAAAGGRLRIAVLPFENLGAGPEQDYIADGLTEEMISHLGRYDPAILGVIARTTVMQYKGTRKTVRQIARELNVGYVLEGSVRREADRVRVTAQLVDVGDQAHRWAGSYERRMMDILELQREFATDIGREIRLTLSPQHVDARSPVAMNPQAYEAYLRGRHLLNDFNPQSVQRSVEYFERAIELEPQYAAPYASLAEAYQHLPMWVGTLPRQTSPLALSAAEKALRFDPHLPEAYASLGLIHANYLWDWEKAETYFERALALNPSCVPARHWYAEFLAEMGRIDESLATIDRARIDDPLSRGIQASRAFVLWFGRRFDEAIADAQRVLDLGPSYPMALIRLGVAYEGKGRFADAVDVFRKAAEAAPELLDSLGLLGHAYAKAGCADDARRQLDVLRCHAERRYVPPFIFSNVYMGLGEADTAVRFMEQEYDARGWYLLLLKHGPRFDVLRSHPGFRALLERMRFP